MVPSNAVVSGIESLENNSEKKTGEHASRALRLIHTEETMSKLQRAPGFDMPKQLILDTNIFYDLGAGSLTPSDVGAADETLWYSPLSVLELAGKWSSRTFPA